MVKRIGLLAAIIFSLLPATLLAQAEDAQHKYTDYNLRANGKIFVVVIVLLIILAGLFLYLIRLDRKIGRLEKQEGPGSK